MSVFPCRHVKKVLLLVCVTVSLARQAGAGDKPVSYRLKQVFGRTVIVSSEGKTIPWTGYGLASDFSVKHWKAKQAVFVKARTNLYQLQVTQGKAFAGRKREFWQGPFWPIAGKAVAVPADALWLTEQTRWLIEQDPEALFIIRTGNTPPKDWRQEHKTHLMPLGGKRFAIKPSFASNDYIRDLDLMLRALVKWCEAQPWRNRIVGYVVFPLGEGVTEAACQGLLFDTTEPMQKAFRAFAQKKYKTDEALQKAWQDDAATLATVRVPEENEWYEKRARQKILHWPDPAKVRRERDYFTLQQQLFHRYCRTMFKAMAESTGERPVIKAFDILKQGMQGWMNVPEFSGDWQRFPARTFGHMLLATGATNTASLLDLAGFDMLQTPGIYFNRKPGYGWEAEGLTDTLTLRGKVNWMEADIRTYVHRDQDGKLLAPGGRDFGKLWNAVEVRAGFDRTLAWAISRNQMYYLMSVCFANWWYHDDTVAAHIAKQWRLLENLQTHPWRDTEHAICLVIDDRAALYEDFSSGFQHLAVFRQIQEGLALCGIPYRIHLLDDLRHEKMPNYKTWLFPNLFKVDEEVLKLLKSKVLRNGNVAIFGPGTGITDGKVRSAKGASKLLGVEMQLILKSCPRRVLMGGSSHALAKRLPTAVYTDSREYGPLLVPKATRFKPEETSARELGSCFYYYFFDRPGLFINEFGLGAAGNGRKGKRGANDYAVVFSPAVPLPPELLRECARYAGSNVWCEQNSVVYACDNFVALHAARSGTYTLRLPRRCRVTEAYQGRKVARRTRAFKVKVTTPRTAMFWLE